MEAMASYRCVQAMDTLSAVRGVGAPVMGGATAAPASAFFGQAGVFEKKRNAVGVKTERRRRGVVEAKIREIFMPALSSTMTEGKIVSWVKNEGDKLSKGESVVVVESDKADMDVETFYDGYLAVIVVDEGEVAPVGAAIGILAETEAEIAEAKAKGGKASAPAAAAPPPPPPPPVAAAPPLPAAVTPAPAAPLSPPLPVVVSTHPAAVDGRVVATPYAKKLAKQFKVDLATVAGSGPLGRIVAADVEAAAGKEPTAAAPLTTPTATPTPAAAVASVNHSAAVKPAPAAAAIVPGTTVPFTAMQKGVSRNMVESLAVPTFQVGYTINTDALDSLYKKIKSKGVTMTALLAKAAALALAAHPVVNASCKDGLTFTYNSCVNVAVAVALDGGLLTPVLADADKVDIYSLSRKWKELVSKARSKTLTPAEFSTGTFALSNLGMFGVDRFTAILPPGMGAIMAVGASQPSLVANKDGSFAVRTQMQVNVTADHRIIYGGDLAEFLQTFARIVEDPKDLVL